MQGSTRLKIIALAAVCTTTMWPAALAEPPTPDGASPPAVVPNFTLSDQAGNPHDLYSLIDAPAIIIAPQVNGDELSREAAHNTGHAAAIAQAERRMAEQRGRGEGRSSAHGAPRASYTPRRGALFLPAVAGADVIRAIPCDMMNFRRRS